MADTTSSDSPADPRYQPPAVKPTVAMVDFGRAIGRDLPRSLKRTQVIAARIRRVSQTPPATKGG